jgi:hypothetical protein
MGYDEDSLWVDNLLQGLAAGGQLSLFREESHDRKKQCIGKSIGIRMAGLWLSGFPWQRSVDK